MDAALPRNDAGADQPHPNEQGHQQDRHGVSSFLPPEGAVIPHAHGRTAIIMMMPAMAARDAKQRGQDPEPKNQTKHCASSFHNRLPVTKKPASGNPDASLAFSLTPDARRASADGAQPRGSRLATPLL